MLPATQREDAICEMAAAESGLYTTPMKFNSLALCSVVLAACATNPTIHRVAAGPAGISVNGYLIEGPNSVVAVDSALRTTDAKALKDKLDSVKKPLVAVLLTHGHPDHYNGVSQLIADKPVPVYSTAAVAEVIRSSDTAKEAQWKPIFKEEWPLARNMPNTVASNGQKLQFDGMTFVLHELPGGESNADSFWVLEAPTRTAFVGDLVMNGSHAYTSDGHTTQWLENLKSARQEIDNVSQVLPGHGEAGTATLLDWQANYLTAYRAEVEAQRKGGASLSDAAKEALAAKMKATYPNLGNEFLISLGADAVAAELAR